MIEWIKKFFDPKLPIKLILFNIITITVEVIGIPSQIILYFARIGMRQMPMMTLLYVIIAICIFIANKYKKLNIAAGIIISLITFIIFPLLFFAGGGINSGMPIYYALGTIFLFMLVDGPMFYVLFFIQMLVYAVSFEISYRYPEVLTPLGTEQDVFIDIYWGVVVVGIIGGIISKFTTRSYNISLKKMEEQNQALIESERKAEEANKAKSEFLSNMSHEIRTPINAVIGMNEMIKREADNKDIREYSDAIGSSASTLLALINDILDFSKIESGKMTIVNARYDVFSLVNDSYMMIKDRAREKGLNVVINCDETLPAYLNGDIIRIRQILVNLLTNAVKYTEKGTITLTINGERIDEKTIKIITSVKDTGIGMKKEDLDTLFDKFVRVNLQHNQGIEGTGLGLTIVNQLTSLMNGTISVDSELGVGSTFTIEVPQIIEEGPSIGKVEFGKGTSKLSAEQGYKPSVVSNKSAVLCVDDVQMNLLVFRKLLKETKIQVDTCTSGKKCLEMIKEKKYDIIFMDHMMPEMNGIETYEKMKEDTEHLNVGTPVVMLTANAISGVEEEYRNIGFNDYLSKPIDVLKLEEVVRKYINT